VDAREGNAVRGRQRSKMIARAATGMNRLGVEECADLVQRITQLDVALAFDRRSALRGSIKAEDDAHGGRLTRSVRSEKPGNHARENLKVEVVDGERVLVALGEVFDFDHVPLRI